MDFSLNWPTRKSLMLLLPLYFHLLSTATAQDQLPYKPTDQIRVNNGEPFDTQSPDGLNWEADSNSKYCPSNSESSSASNQQGSVPKVPYFTARISQSNFTCIFPVTMGPKFLRLYFYPAPYSGLSPSDSFFSVTANGYSLLKNFRVQSHLTNSNSYLEKEFIITVFESQQLNLTFTPSPNSFAFINGIEIISMPNNLYIKDADNPYTFVNQLKSPFYFANFTSLETVVRLNVGGPFINKVNDTGMFRKWDHDTDYVYGGRQGVVSRSPGKVTIKYTSSTPAFVAPKLVYTTMRSMGRNPLLNLNYNLTWIFPVDAGFNYLVRLHFCETRSEVNYANAVIFTIFINNQTVEDQISVIYLSGGQNSPVYRDYVVWLPEGSHTKQDFDVWLALHPYNIPSTKTNDAFLNGLEIFKLNNSAGSLAPSNPPPTGAPPPDLQVKTKSKSGPAKAMIVVGPVLFGILAITLVSSFLICKQRRVRVSGKRIEVKSFRLPFSFTSRSNINHNHFRRFSLFEIEIATAKFDDEFVIGSGGFGNVYKGFIDDGATPVAIKRLHSSSKQGAREFRTEIQLLSELRHQNLVSLIGYCDDPGEMVLVYEYMNRGTLRDHLYKTRNPPLQWKRRLEICIGAARGLHYLHTGAKHPIIHRDVKSTNILVDQNWVAKVSDFGLSRTGPTSQSQTHVSTVVRGSFGYVDPEYYRRQHLTEKSDVYSFGVVLFEVLCARPAVIPGLPREQVNLSDWSRICYRRGALGQIMDPNLRGDIDPVCMGKFGEIGERCLREQGAERPTMSDIVMELELALHLQETAEKNRISVDATGSEEQESPLLMRREAVVTTGRSDDDEEEEEEELFSGSNGEMEESKSTISSGVGSIAQSDPDRFRSRTVFSELKDEKGR